ncbi:MAG TPA: hypothetical protein VG456_13360 [Candidatus Sulfopaludibacter sp.]|nr:hypothetical protein [Candidatus Sulfopaludibacter sp.]
MACVTGIGGNADGPFGDALEDFGRFGKRFLRSLAARVACKLRLF